MQLGGMQLMRHVLDISGNFISQPPNFPQLFLLQHTRMCRGGLVTFLNSVSQQRKPLVDVIMQLASDTRSFLLTRPNEPATEFDHGRSGLPQFADVHATAYISGKRTVAVVPRRAHAYDPTVFSVLATKPIFHPEFFLAIKAADISFQALRQIFWMHTVSPAIAKLLL